MPTVTFLIRMLDAQSEPRLRQSARVVDTDDTAGRAMPAAETNAIMMNEIFAPPAKYLSQNIALTFLNAVLDRW